MIQVTPSLIFARYVLVTLEKHTHQIANDYPLNTLTTLSYSMPSNCRHNSVDIATMSYGNADVNRRITMNLDGLGEEQIHTLLMLVTLNIIVFAALIVQIETEVAVSGICALF